jgi:DNA-binding MarR family transcriptional regulator
MAEATLLHWVSKLNLIGNNVEFLRDRIFDAIRSDGRDFSIRQLAVLVACFIVGEPSTIRGLAEKLEVPKPAISRAVDRLEREKFIRRKKRPC